MNAKKILNQLIRVFAAINVVLFIGNFMCRGNEYLLSQERITHITKLFERDGISITTELSRDFVPKYTANLVFLGSSVAVRDKVTKRFFDGEISKVKRSTERGNNQVNGKKLCYTLGDERLAFDGNELIYTNAAAGKKVGKLKEEQAKNLCKKLLSRISKNKVNENYNVHIIEEEDYLKVIYYPTLEGVPILDSYMTFDVYSDGVASANMFLAQVEIQGEEKKDIYSVDLVLFGMEDYFLENNYLQINKVSLCYKFAGDEENILGQQIIPVYKIEVDGLEEPLFVNAYSNKVLK